MTPPDPREAVIRTALTDDLLDKAWHAALVIYAEKREIGPSASPMRDVLVPALLASLPPPDEVQRAQSVLIMELLWGKHSIRMSWPDQWALVESNAQRLPAPPVTEDPR